MCIRDSNYTNPMSLCVKTLYHVFPQIKAFGCCHEVFGTQKVLKGIAEDVLGLKHIDRKDIQVNVLGINHFTWFDYASYKGIDLFPMYRKYVDEHFEEGYACLLYTSWKASSAVIPAFLTWTRRDKIWLNTCWTAQQKNCMKKSRDSGI